MDEVRRDELRELFRSGYFFARQKAALRGLNPVDAPPSWIDEELTEALNNIQGPHERKKRTTVLRLAEAKASGLSVKEVFDSEDCCSPPTWYGRKKPFVKEGWRDFPDVATAYEIAERRAHGYYDALEEQRMAMRRHVLDETQDRLTEISGAAAEVLLEIMLDPDSASDVRRKAAVDALTHAAPETAPKGQVEQSVDLRVANAGPSMRDIRNRSRVMGDRIVDSGSEDVPEIVQVQELAEGGQGLVPSPPPGGLTIPQTGLYDEPPQLSGNGNGEEGSEDES